MANDKPKPILKWVGGKRQTLAIIREAFPDQYGTYYEPFLGGGSVLFDLAPKKAVVNDLNSEIINVYRVVKESPEALIEKLRTFKNEKEFFYGMRVLDRSGDYAKMSDIDKAARTIYLNRTCFNGVYRVNSSGHFNVPYANNEKADFVREKEILSVSRYFNENDIAIKNGNFADALNGAGKNDLVYLDPPYDPLDGKEHFVGYGKERFGTESLLKLAEAAHKLAKKGAYVVISNSATEKVRKAFEQYPEFQVLTIKSRRAINCKGGSRGPIDEFLIKNF